MDRMLYVGMSGARQRMLALRSINNNLANATTTGFREDLNQFRSMPVFGPGHATRVYAMDERPGINFAQGPLQHTGRDLDLAIDGDGWFTVQAPDGTEALTRAGNLTIGPGGLLMTGSGYLLMGDNGPIALPPAESISVGRDGTISIRPVGQSPQALVEVGRIKLVNPPREDLEKGEDGLVRIKEGGFATPDVNVRVQQGALEGSNVNPVQAMVEMINLQRQYEMQVKMMKTANDNAEAAESLLRIS